MAWRGSCNKDIIGEIPIYKYYRIKYRGVLRNNPGCTRIIHLLPRTNTPNGLYLF